MRRPRSITLLGLGAPLLLLAQFTPTSCIPTTGTGGDTGGPLFNLPPTIVLTTDIQRGVAPLTVLFSSSGSTDDGVIVERLWDFGDGVGTSQEISPTYTFLTTGTFTVHLTLTDDQGAQSTRSTIISVTERPVAVIDVDRTSAESAPALFSFDGSASFDPDAEEGDELLYRWDFGDGSRELLPVVTHTFATPGTYRVRLTVTDAVGVTGFAERIIEVGIPRPRISFRSPPPDVTNIVCSSDSPLWVHAVYDVEPGVPYTISAGLDGDRDSCDAQIVLYDPRTGTELCRLIGAEGPVRAAAFSPDPDSPTVLTGDDGGSARLYDATTGTLLREYGSQGAAISGLAFASDGASFVVGCADGTVVIRKTNSNAIVHEFAGHAAAVNAVAYAPDGKKILTGDESGLAILWNVSDQTAILRYDHGDAAVTAVAFSPTDPQRVLTGSDDSTARLWSTVNGQLGQEFAPVFNDGVLVAGHADAVTSVAFSSDGTQIVTGSEDNTVILWNMRLGSQVRTFSTHTDAVRSVAFSPEGTQIITGSDDDTAVIWDVATGERRRTFQPCRSPIAAVAFAPDGATVLAAVAAANDIRLDTDPPSGNDLNLTLPTALDLSEVPTGDEGREYYLWIELQTDRTDQPSRTYARQERENRSSVYTRVTVISPFTTAIDAATPVIPLRRVSDPEAEEVRWEEASILMPGTQQRQVFSLDQFDVGDRISLSLLSTPGYGETYTQDGFSLLILDELEEMYAWYESECVLFSRDTKLIIGHASDYYLVLDGVGGEFVPSIHVRIQREFADDSAPRQQYVYLNFNAGTVRALTVAGSAQFDLPAFDDGVTEAGYDATAVKLAIEARVAALYSPYRFEIDTQPPAVSTDPYLTIYFDTYFDEDDPTASGPLVEARIPDRNGDFVRDENDLQFYGLTNYIDPRNATLSGRAVISVNRIMVDYRTNNLTDAELGLAIGNAVAHHVGLLSGLRETTQTFPDDIMTDDETEVANPALQFTTAELAPSSPALDAVTPLGVQDAEQLLTELFGTD